MTKVRKDENNAKRVINWRKRTRRKLVEAFGGKCCICGYDKCDRALAFHHLQPDKKDFGIASAFRNNMSWEKIKKEVDGCVLVCGNCHMEIHDGLTTVPENAPRFNESLIDYSELKDNCFVCGNEKWKNKKYCSKICASKDKPKKPSVWDGCSATSLLHLRKELGTNEKIGQYLGISETAVRKRIKVIVKKELLDLHEAEYCVIDDNKISLYIAKQLHYEFPLQSNEKDDWKVEQLSKNIFSYKHCQKTNKRIIKFFENYIEISENLLNSNKYFRDEMEAEFSRINRK
jgi:hypothetical protein